MFETFDKAVQFWNDTPEAHTDIFQTFFKLVNEDVELKAHRDFVEEYEFGYGDRPFHWMWNLIAQRLPEDFKFLEIGVYQGQVISLMSLLNKKYNKNGKIWGLTPLANVDDAFSKHHEVNYEERIGILYQYFGLEGTDLAIIEGLSTDMVCVVKAQKFSPYDCIYIDGGHDYETVVADINNFGPMVKQGGLLVMDDSANYLNIPDGLIRMDWRGLISVSNAVKDVLETDSSFKHIFSVGHNRVWEKV